MRKVVGEFWGGRGKFLVEWGVRGGGVGGAMARSGARGGGAGRHRGRWVWQGGQRRMACCARLLRRSTG